MKFFSSFAVAFFAAQAVLGNPLEKRATVNDVATLGYATQNGGTTGGSGGPVTVVTTLAALTSAVSGSAKKIVVIQGTITGNAVVRVGSNTSVLGRGATLNGIGLRVLEESNVIIRNIKISKVLAEAGDAIGIQSAHNVWVDHLDLSSDMDHDKDFYDGLLDVTHGSYGITVTYTRLHNHWKCSLVGHSDSNGSEDAALRVTYAYNVFDTVNSRTPSFRFGQGHIFNNYFTNNGDSINSRDGAQLLVENNKFVSSNDPLYSTDGGFAVARGNDFGSASNTAPAGTLTSVPYSYSLVASTSVQSMTSSAGNTLTL